MADTILPLDRQLKNRNFLQPTGFKFTLGKYPKVDFFSNTAQIPSINLGVAFQPTYLKDIPIPGDKLTYDDLVIDFLVDEDLVNYRIVHQWLERFGYPESVEQYQDLLDLEEGFTQGQQFAEAGQSDGTLIIFNSNFNPIASVKFTGLFPVSLSTVEFNAKAQDIEYVSASVTLKYTHYTITKY